MTEKRFYMDKSGDLYDRENKTVMIDFGYSYDGVGCKRIIDLLNELHEENICLKKMLQDFKTCTNQKSKSKKRDYTSMRLYDNKTEKELEECGKKQ